ncbi:MAG: zf-HC2 domain-containing protein [Bryobacterales bacterium]|nr:zf-HC2 domain-containing protein [Bryobacterales bacterium]
MRIFTRQRHVNEEALGLHALNDLPESRRERVARHLSGCTHCRGKYREAEELIHILRVAAKRTSLGAVLN